MNYSGMDLHSSNSLVTVTDEEDRVMAEKRLPNDLEKIRGFLAPWRATLKGVVVESTFNWYRLVEGLQAEGFQGHLANTTAIKRYEGLKHGGDESAVRYLAHLLRRGILPTGTILPPEQRAVRDLARKRMPRVRSRTTPVLAVENLTARQHGTRIGSHQVKRRTVETVDRMGLAEDVALTIQTDGAVITTLSEQIEVLEQRLRERIGERPEYVLLMSVPGIGRVLAITVPLETGPIDRFANGGHFASYARCVDSVRRQEERRREHTKRQRLFVLGLR